MQLQKSMCAAHLNSHFSYEIGLRWLGLLVLVFAVLISSSSAFAGDQPGTSPGRPIDPRPDIAFPEVGIRVNGPESCEVGGYPKVCTYSVTLTNHGAGTYRGTLFFNDYIHDEGPPETSGVHVYSKVWRYGIRAFRCWPASSVLRGTCGFDTIGPGLRCSLSSGSASCGYPLVNLQPGANLMFKFDFLLPEGLENDVSVLYRGGVENCAKIRWPMKFVDHGDGSFAPNIVANELHRLGYIRNLIEVFDPARFEAAIRRFQSDHGLAETGAVDNELTRALFPRSAQMRGDANEANDLACVTIPVTGSSK